MTTKEQMTWLDRRVYLHTAERLHVLCIVLDARESYGNLHLEVAPVAGSGTAWVAADRCDIESGPIRTP